MTATLLSGPTPRQTGSLDRLWRDCISVETRVSGSSHGNSRKPLRGGSSLGATVAEVSRRCEVNANVLLRWRREMRDDAGQAFAGAGRRDHQQESDVVELDRKVGRQALVKTMRRQTQIRYICSKTICYLRSNIGPLTEMTRE